MSSLQYWIRKTHGKPLAQADFQDAPAGAQPCLNRTCSEIELHVLRLRRELALGPLGEIGASAISRALAQQFPDVALPCPRTIHRILERHGLLDGRRRVRRPAPPRGWYLPALASHQVELDCFDGVDGLVIRGGQCLEVFTAISHWGGLPAAWPLPRLTTDAVLSALQEHWRQHGLPAYAQFDNATIFSGAHHFADTFGRVVRLCLQLGVVPVFCPVQETGFQAQIESFNGRWQIAVWQRFAHRSLATVCRRNHPFYAPCAAACNNASNPLRHAVLGPAHASASSLPDYLPAALSICAAPMRLVRPSSWAVLTKSIRPGKPSSCAPNSISPTTLWLFTAYVAAPTTLNPSCGLSRINLTTPANPIHPPATMTPPCASKSPPKIADR